MFGINENLEFIPVHVAILVVSDTRTMDTDTSGKTLGDRITNSGHKVFERLIVPDDKEAIREAVKGWIENSTVDVVISTGGTGLTG
ncbi:MAG: molybdopterin-binding protein, partial [Pseudomonadota bacterium]